MPVVKDWSEHAAVKATVQEDWKVLLDAPTEFWRNKEVGQAALESAKQQESMENMIAELAKNRNFVMGTGALELASEELKNDPVVVKFVVQHTGHALQYASDELKNDPTFLQDAVQANVQVMFQLIGEEARAAQLAEIVRANPSAAYVRNSDGRRAIDVAHAKCKEAMAKALRLFGAFDVDSGPPLHISRTACVLAATCHKEGGAEPTTRVALKGMRELDQVLKELNGRDGLDSRFVIAVLAVYVDASADKALIEEAAAKCGARVEHVTGMETAMRAQLQNRSARAAEQQATAEERNTGFRFVLVLELGERGLSAALTHDHVAGENLPAVRQIAADLADCLAHLHEKGRIHADLKPLNAVRVGSTWQLIDLDVCCRIGDNFGTKVPSSGYCPPEMAKLLLAATDMTTGKVDTAKLDKYQADVAYDLWSFGVVLFHLCFGRPLWLTDQNDNVTLDDLRILGAAPGGKWPALLQKALYPGEHRNASVDLKAAASLLRKLLEPEPSKRLEHFASTDRSMQAVLEEPFFQGQSVDDATLQQMNAKIDRIEQDAVTIIDMSEEHRTELRRTCEVLLKAVFEATGVVTPTAFIVLEEKLPDTDRLEKQISKLQLKDDGTAAGIGSEAKFLIVETAKKRFDHGMAWVERLQTLAEGVVEADPDKVFGHLKETFEKLVTAKTLYFYLVDELTGTPVRAKGYPIEITKPSEVVPKLLPVMQVGMRAMSLYNGAEGIARMFGAPLPSVPTEWRKGAQVSIELLKQQKSVEAFGLVHELAISSGDAAEKRQKSVRGASLRELQRFFETHDTDQTYAGLRRLGDDDGMAVWTVLTDEKEVRAEIEKRSRERRAEESARDEMLRSMLLQQRDETSAPQRMTSAADVGAEDEEATLNARRRRRTRGADASTAQSLRQQQQQQSLRQLLEMQADLLLQMQADLEEVKNKQAGQAKPSQAKPWLGLGQASPSQRRADESAQDEIAATESSGSEGALSKVPSFFSGLGHKVQTAFEKPAWKLW